MGLFSLSPTGTSAQRLPHFISANISTVFALALSLPHKHTSTVLVLVRPSLLFRNRTIIMPKIYHSRAAIELWTTWQNYNFFNLHQVWAVKATGIHENMNLYLNRPKMDVCLLTTKFFSSCFFTQACIYVFYPLVVTVLYNT